eukprot:TRINITY_DN62746_c0_g1_i1.p1 TRINITY_DN62746_c0_g1~~TRINITY_DN62746_c0_g1_i1.p1  ORF type:complete len:107 (-),score=10.23 TRINITY_DN62746_c0_g1_i1:2-322(-)
MIIQIICEAGRHLWRISSFLSGSLSLGTMPVAKDCRRSSDQGLVLKMQSNTLSVLCLLYTSDAADEEDSVDLGGCRIIKKKKNSMITQQQMRFILDITRHEEMRDV